MSGFGRTVHLSIIVLLTGDGCMKLTVENIGDFKDCSLGALVLDLTLSAC